MIKTQKENYERDCSELRFYVTPWGTKNYDYKSDRLYNFDDPKLPRKVTF